MGENPGHSTEDSPPAQDKDTIIVIPEFMKSSYIQISDGLDLSKYSPPWRCHIEQARQDIRFNIHQILGSRAETEFLNQLNPYQMESKLNTITPTGRRFSNGFLIASPEEITEYGINDPQSTIVLVKKSIEIKNGFRGKSQKLELPIGIRPLNLSQIHNKYSKEFSTFWGSAEGKEKQVPIGRIEPLFYRHGTSLHKGKAPEQLKKADERTAILVLNPLQVISDFNVYKVSEHVKKNFDKIIYNRVWGDRYAISMCTPTDYEEMIQPYIRGIYPIRKKPARRERKYW